MSGGDSGRRKQANAGVSQQWWIVNRPKENVAVNEAVEFEAHSRDLPNMDALQWEY